MNSSCLIKVAKDVEICSITHMKKPPLTKNHQTNRNARYFLETILLSVMVYIMIGLPTQISSMVIKIPFAHKAHGSHFIDAKIDFVGASMNLPSSKNVTLSL